MKLFDNAASPYSFKVRVTLYEKGIDFEKHEIRHEQQRAEFLRRNPRGEVPALQDGDTVIYDSSIICEYLEETHPSPPLLPPAPAARARCRNLERVADMQLDPVLLVLGLIKIFRPGLEEQFPNVLPQAQATLRKHCANLNDELAGKEYLVGEFSRADIAFVPHLTAAALLGLQAGEGFPHLSRWLERLNGRASIQRTTQEAMAAFQQAQTETDPFFDNARLHWRDARIEWAIRFGLGRWLLDDIAAGRGFFSPIP